MKLLLVITQMGSGGAERQIAGLASAIVSKGHRVRLCWFEGECFYERETAVPGLEKSCFSPGPRVLRTLKLLREILRFRPDTVIAFLDGAVKASIKVRRILPWLRFTLILSERNVTRSFDAAQNAKYRSYRVADKVVCNSYTQAENLRSRFPELSSKILTITNFVDLNRFRPAPANPQQQSVLPGPADTRGNATRDGGLLPLKNRTRIGIVARIAKQKNVGRFIEAATEFSKNHPEVLFDWYGSGSNSPAKPGPVRFRGEVRDIENVYRKIDVLCLPSLYEGFPNVVCEAMASGLPVLCSRVCDNPRLVEDGVNGFLFDPLSVRSMAGALEKFISLTPDQRAGMGRESRLRAEKLLSEDRFIAAWTAIL